MQPSGCCPSKWPHWEYHCWKHELLLFFFFPFPELFSRAGVLTTEENCSYCLIFPSCLSRDAINLFTRLQSRWLFEYFQKSNSPTSIEDNKYLPQSSFCIPGTVLSILHEFSHWRSCEVLGNYFFSFLHTDKLRYKIVKKLAWSHIAIRSRKSEIQTWQ